MIKSSLIKACSYLWDVQIDYRESEINGDLIVFLSKGRYQLCTANAIYSYEDKYDNFANIFKAFNFEKLNGNQVLILGLGLGSIPIILDRLRPASWNFTGIEIDEAVCELAALYGYSKIQSPLETLVTDASNYLQSCNRKFDLICIDLFIDDVMPSTAREVSFLNEVRRCLSDDGAVVANTLAFTDAHRQHSRHFFNNTFAATFPDAVLHHTHLNYMLVNHHQFIDATQL